MGGQKSRRCGRKVERWRHWRGETTEIFHLGINTSKCDSRGSMTMIFVTGCVLEAPLKSPRPPPSISSMSQRKSYRESMAKIDTLESYGHRLRSFYHLGRWGQHQFLAHYDEVRCRRRRPSLFSKLLIVLQHLPIHYGKSVPYRR